MSAAPAHAAAGDDVAAGVIGEVGRSRHRPFDDLGRNVVARPRRLSARDAQGFEETLGDRIGFAAGQPPRPRRRIEALDRHHIGHAEPREGVAHIAFADEAADVGKLRRQRLDRLAPAAERIGKIVDQDRAGDLHFDRPGESPRRQTRACARLQRKHRVVTGRTGVEQVSGAEIGLVARQRLQRALGLVFEVIRGIERQQHRHRAASDPGESACVDGVELHQRRRCARIPCRHAALAGEGKSGSDRRRGWRSRCGAGRELPAIRRGRR